MGTIKEKNAAVRRSHRIHELLMTRFFYGATNKELAAALGTSPVNIHRDLETLEEMGYARKTEEGRFEATTKALQIYRAFTIHYENQQSRLSETARTIEAGGRRVADQGVNHV